MHTRPFQTSKIQTTTKRIKKSEDFDLKGKHKKNWKAGSNYREIFCKY